MIVLPIGREGRRGGVEPVRENPVEPEIADDDKTSVGRQCDGMHVRRSLPRGIDAVAGVLDDVRRPERAVRQKRDRGGDARVVIGHEERALRGIDDEMTRRRAAGGLRRLQRGERAAREIGAERRGHGVGLAHGVECFLVGRERDERRAVRLGGEHRRRQRAGGGIEPHGVDALARGAGVRADENQLAGGGG
jgi:hypothetical protein